MKRTLPAFVFLLFVLSTFGQTEFAPPGATWSYTYQTYWTNFNGFFVLKYEKDTLLNNYACKKLHASILDSALIQTYQLDYYIRQSGDSIFTEFPGLDFSIFLFKNKYQVNETAEFGFLWDEPLAVSAVETLNFNGQDTRKFTLDSDDVLFDQTAIYELFGPELGFFQSWWGVHVDGESYRLLCYQDDAFPLAEVGNGPCFGLTPTLENTPEKPSLVLSPNPANHILTLDFKGENAASMTIRVFDLAGRLAMQAPLPKNRQLDVSRLPSGMYFGTVAADHQNLPFRFVKQ